MSSSELCLLLGCVGWFFGYRRKKKTPQESRCAVYEDPDSLPSAPRTAGNLAYEHIGGSGERSTELKGPIYEEPEDIKPDPHIQGNLLWTCTVQLVFNSESVLGFLWAL